MSMSGPTTELPVNKTEQQMLGFTIYYKLQLHQQLTTEKCSLSPVNSQIFPILK